MEIKWRNYNQEKVELQQTHVAAKPNNQAILYFHSVHTKVLGQPDREAQSRQGNVKVWPLIKKYWLSLQLIFFCVCAFLSLPVDPPKRFVFVNKALIGEGLTEWTHPGYHSLFHINLYNVMGSVLHVWAPFSELFLCFHCCRVKSQVWKTVLCNPLKVNRKKWHKHHCVVQQDYKKWQLPLKSGWRKLHCNGLALQTG